MGERESAADAGPLAKVNTNSDRRRGGFLSVPFQLYPPNLFHHFPLSLTYHDDDDDEERDEREREREKHGADVSMPYII